MNKISIAGNALAFSEKGTGEAVLLLHGITTWSFIWEPVIQELSANFRIIAPDLLGCGHSDKPLDRDYSLPAHAERLYQLVQELKIDSFHLVGHDVGGGIAQIFAVRHPAFIKSLTLVNSIAYDFWPVQPIIAVRTPVIKYLAMASLDFGSLKLIVRRGLFHKDRLNSELFEQFKFPLKTSLGKKAFMRFARSLDNKHLLDISPELKKMKSPVLIIRGADDVYLSAGIAHKLKEEIPGSQLIIMREAGHFIQIDAPAKLSDAMKRFMNQGRV